MGTLPSLIRRSDQDLSSSGETNKVVLEERCSLATEDSPVSQKTKLSGSFSVRPPSSWIRLLFCSRFRPDFGYLQFGFPSGILTLHVLRVCVENSSGCCDILDQVIEFQTLAQCILSLFYV